MSGWWREGVVAEKNRLVEGAYVGVAVDIAGHCRWTCISEDVTACCKWQRMFGVVKARFCESWLCRL